MQSLATAPARIGERFKPQDLLCLENESTRFRASKNEKTKSGGISLNDLRLDDVGDSESPKETLETGADFAAAKAVTGANVPQAERESRSDLEAKRQSRQLGEGHNLMK
ncbi:hypothetical protein [Leptospira wolffii]|uniref:hypothetical protein n=1 Tax=Leptospira wolffii TaxID=409998 RepID=UPI00058D57B0|nr:hypothetical protein [Leptospira wolffii]